MFKSTGSGKAKKPAGGYGSRGGPQVCKPNTPYITTDEIYSEQRLAGKVTMKEALNVKCPKTQMKGRVTNRNGKAP